MRRPLSFIVSLGVACAAIGTTAARAADLPARAPAPVYKAPAALPYNWSGFYLGLNGGYGWGRSSWSDPTAGADSGSFSTNGGLIGGQMGYNWQTGAAVIGLETDADWTNIKGSTAGPGGVCAIDGAGMCQTQQNWIGTTRLRLGYAADRWLPYVTGGVAYGDIQVNQITGNASTTRAGWTAGGGLEVGSTATGAPRWNTCTSISAPPCCSARRRARRRSRCR